MKIQTKPVKKSLNKAFYKQSLKRADINQLKANLVKLYSRYNESESEEHLKNILSDFLKETWYTGRFEINTKGRIDLAIHNGKTSKDSVGVIIEAKKPQSPERMTLEGFNCKALHELILYYFEERKENKNIQVKHLIATNNNEWFIFDENEFDKVFYRNTKLQKLYKAKVEQCKDNPFFYSEAQNIIEDADDLVECTYLKLRDFEKAATIEDNKDDNKLIELYKVLSPEHLLKLPFQNDSNSLNKEFYNELLHIIGLEEIKEGSKKLITRKKPENRDDGSLLENTINILRVEGGLANVRNAEQYGDSEEERLFSVGLELCINWLNRILFLKLLEGQLINYHRDNQDFSFLNSRIIQDFDELNELFFEVLAVKPNERTKSVNQKFGNIPYLNSSLFERSELEGQTIRINSLKDRLEIPVYRYSVVKDERGNRIADSKTTLRYLFEFLNAYDFSSESSAKIQEQNKTIINASVLGLIFEKINGYKDGSFFTPGFITMYMCRETLRRAVVQKFNDCKGWNITDFNDVKEKIDFTNKEERQAANDIINSLKICDPAVGSGHFLVSALNEIIAIKSELGVLQYRDGSRIRGYRLAIENDELIIVDEETDQLFEYHLNQHYKPIGELQALQEAIFHERQTIIENCLFGVDINPKSVMICRLRLWVELLKNAYYTKESNYAELETLPNIDINIKCGNSLISRFALDSDLKQALKKSKWNIDTYRVAVQTYRNAKSKAEKHDMEKLITSIKNDFESEIARNDKRLLKLVKLKGDLTTLTTQTTLFERTKKEQDEWNKKINAVTTDIQKLETELEEVKNNAIYRNAFEWRFEFPEVLNDDGDYVGFDVVIGNPPYGVTLSKSEDNILRDNYKVSNYQIDTYTIFTELANNILHQKGNIVFIIPNAWYASIYDIKFRQYLIDNNLIKSITECPKNTFEEAIVETCIIHISKNENDNNLNIYSLNKQVINNLDKSIIKTDKDYTFQVFASSEEQIFKSRIRNQFSVVDNYFDVVWGIKVYEKGKGYPPQNGTESIKKIFHSQQKIDETYKPLLGGSEIFPFIVKWNGAYIKYGPWIAAPRQPEWFKAIPRILVREITSKGRIYAAFIDDEYVFSNSVDGIRSKSANLEQLLQLLGVLNSKFASYYHLKSSSNAQKDSFPKMLLQNLRDFPFEPTINKRLTSKVSQLIEHKKNNSLIDTSIIESEIDQLVYELYGLTEEEIRIVEGEVG